MIEEYSKIKNMDYKKEYERAFGIAKIWYRNTAMPDNVKSILSNMFPELKEGEKIRKELIRAFESLNTIKVWNGIERTDILAWLEKQGEGNKASSETADEKEKREFVSNGFIECRANFQDFREGKTYWLKYLGDDKYNVRSDNLLGKTYHISPRHLYTIFKKQTEKSESSIKTVGESLGLETQEDYDNYNQIVSNLIDDAMTGPKFKKDDWIVFDFKGSTVHRILKIEADSQGILSYCLQDTDGHDVYCSIEEVDKNAKLWTIQDANFGDVLVHKDCTFIFMGIDKDGIVQAIDELWTEESRAFGEPSMKNAYRPATFNQRCRLFQEIRDIRYEWDDKKKQLIKLDKYRNVKRIC